MMSRAKYLKGLERDLEATRKIIDDLTQENHELKEILKMIQYNDRRPTHSPNRAMG